MTPKRFPRKPFGDSAASLPLLGTFRPTPGLCVHVHTHARAHTLGRRHLQRTAAAIRLLNETTAERRVGQPVELGSEFIHPSRESKHLKVLPLTQVSTVGSRKFGTPL